MVAKDTEAHAAPNALYPEDSKLQPGPLLLISGERVEFNPHPLLPQHDLALQLADQTVFVKYTLH
jgi:hypothetical protein